MRVAATLVMAVALMGAADAQTPSSLSFAWAADWSGKKLDPMMRLYASDPVFLPTSGERWEGAAAIRKNLAAGLSRFTADLRLHSIKSETSGTLAYDSGSYEETVMPVRGGKAMHLKGNYLFVLVREHGDWKIREQTFTEFDAAKL